MDVAIWRRLYDDVQAQVRSQQSLEITEENYGTFLPLIIMELLPHEVQLNINRNLDEELWNFTRLLTIIKCEIKAREKCTTAIEQEKVGKNVFSSEEPLSAASLAAVRNLIGLTNVEQSLIQVHESSFWNKVVTVFFV